MESLFITGAVIGFTQLVKSLFDRDFRTATIITGSAIIGGLAGFFRVDGVTLVSTGILLGLGASGFVTVAQAVGGQKISNQ